MLLVGLAIAAALLGGLIYNGMRERGAAEAALDAETAEAAAPFVEVVHPVGGAPDQTLVLPGQTMAFIDTPIYARASGYLKSWNYDIGAHVKRGDVLAVDRDARTRPAVARGAGATGADAGGGDAGGGEYGPRQSDERPHLGAGAARLDQPAAGRPGPADLCGEHGRGRRRARQRAGGAGAGGSAGGVDRVRARDRAVRWRDHRAQHRCRRADQRRGGEPRPPSCSTWPRPGRCASSSRCRRPTRRICTRATPATVTFDEYPGQAFHGALARTDGAINPASRTLLVEVDVDNSDGKLLPGAYAFVHFTLPRQTHSVVIPANTLLFRSEGLRVAVVRNGGRGTDADHHRARLWRPRRGADRSQHGGRGDRQPVGFAGKRHGGAPGKSQGGRGGLPRQPLTTLSQARFAQVRDVRAA